MRQNTFSTRSLDRLGRLRKDSAALAEQLAGGRPLVIPLAGDRIAVRSDGDRAAIVTVEMAEAADVDLWLLGRIDGTVYAAVDLGDDPAARDDLAPDVRWSGLREVAGLLNADDANLLATATGLAVWHRTHRYCGACGAPTTADWSGHRRRCDSCGREHFPRTDPAIIVLVTHDDRALLARNPAWPPGFSSVLAGFVEPGESLEDAVSREVMEEVGLPVEAVAYQSSQPWPFPSSIMLGFRAEAAHDDLDPDPEEIADARFYSRKELADGVTALPPPMSIARRLLDDWLAGTGTPTEPVD
ncbi:MAG TPA: NAD(+) diphosphatase [Acidimicrobiales bacterium]|nr:NAD(+) diphosphatase [Acidimicrobiales bacterium]